HRGLKLRAFWWGRRFCCGHTPQGWYARQAVKVMTQPDPIPTPGSALLPEQSAADSPCPAEARAHPRYEVPPGTVCRLLTITGGESLTAEVVNISCGGVRLVAEMPLARGTVLMTELKSRSGLFARALLTHVIHVGQEDDGRFSMGGEFLDPLTDEEL